jgi:hypothetical protein
MGKGVFWVANKIDSCFKRNAENQPITLKVETMDQIPKYFFYKPKNPSIIILQFQINATNCS